MLQKQNFKTIFLLFLSFPWMWKQQCHWPLRPKLSQNKSTRQIIYSSYGIHFSYDIHRNYSAGKRIIRQHGRVQLRNVNPFKSVHQNIEFLHILKVLKISNSILFRIKSVINIEIRALILGHIPQITKNYY